MILRDDEAAYLDVATGEIVYNTNVEDYYLFREAALMLLGLNDVLRRETSRLFQQGIRNSDVDVIEALSDATWKEVRRQLREYYNIDWPELRRWTKDLEPALLRGEDWGLAIAQLADRINIRPRFAFRFIEALVIESPNDFYDDQEHPSASPVENGVKGQFRDLPIPEICLIIRNYCKNHSAAVWPDYVMEIATDGDPAPRYLIYRENRHANIVINHARRNDNAND